VGGESVTVTFGIGLALLPVALVGICLLAAAYLSATGIAAYVMGTVGGLLLVATIVVTQVLGMIVRAALYQYATTGEPVGPLEAPSPDDIFSGDWRCLVKPCMSDRRSLLRFIP